MCWLLWPERRLLLLVLLAGALGSTVHGLRSLRWYTGQRELVQSWTLYYLALPFTGPGLAFILYLVIRGGFFNGNAPVGAANTLAFVALAALGGMFSEEAIQKLKTIAGALFEKAPTGKNAASAGPVITAVTPVKLAPTDKAIFIVGTGFDSGSKVFADSQALKTTFHSAILLEAEIPNGLHQAGKAFAVTVLSSTGAKSAASNLTMI